jgi:hypothetical protein
MKAIDNQLHYQTQVVNNQSGSAFFFPFASASQVSNNVLANTNVGPTSLITQNILKNQKGTQSQILTGTSNTTVSQVGINDAANLHIGNGSSTQTLVGSQVFDQNQHTVNSNNAQAGQNALNEEQNTNNNIAGGTAPTTQAIFGDNQKLGQTQTISRSSGSNTQDSVTNLMQNLNDSPHNSKTIQNIIKGSQSIQHTQTIGNSPNSQNTIQESNQQLNTNHNDDPSGVTQQLTKITQSDRFTQSISNAPGSINTFSNDHVVQNLH